MAGQGRAGQGRVGRGREAPVCIPIYLSTYNLPVDVCRQEKNGDAVVLTPPPPPRPFPLFPCHLLHPPLNRMRVFSMRLSHPTPPPTHPLLPSSQNRRRSSTRLSHPTLLLPSSQHRWRSSWGTGRRGATCSSSPTTPSPRASSASAASAAVRPLVGPLASCCKR